MRSRRRVRQRVVKGQRGRVGGAQLQRLHVGPLARQLLDDLLDAGDYVGDEVALRLRGREVRDAR